MKVISTIAGILPPPDKRIAMRGAMVVITLAIMTGIVLTLKLHAQSFLLTTLQKQALEQSIKLQTDDLELQLLTTSPGITLTGLSMTSAHFSSTIYAEHLQIKSGWGKFVTGNTMPDQVVLQNAQLRLDPSDLDLVRPASTRDETQAVFDPFALLLEPLPIPDTHITLETVEISIADADPAKQTQLIVNGTIQSTESVTLANLDAHGDYHHQPLKGSFTYRTTNRVLLGSESKLIVDANLSESTIASTMVTAKRKGSTPATATLVANGYKLEKLMEFFGGPDIENGELTGKLSIGKDTITISDMNMLLGRADLRADMEIKTHTKQDTRPSLTVHLRSNYLPLGELLPLERKGRATPSQDTKNTAHKIFSNDPPALYELVQQWDANVQFNASKIQYQGYEITDLFAAALVKDSKAAFSVQSPGFASGVLTGKAQYDAVPDTVPAGYLTLGVRNMNLEKSSIEPGVSDIIAAGKLTGDAELWFNGFSEASLAASLDGDIYALLEDGQLDSMAVELAGADIMESIRLLWRKELQQIEVSCGYASAHFSSGLGALNHFVVDSADSLFNATGTVDLNTEQLDLTFSPVPHDGSLLTATTPIHIKGTLAAPKVRPGRKLYARFAAAAVLVSLTGPAAALLPFIGVGDGGESSSCAELFSIH